MGMFFALEFDEEMPSREFCLVAAESLDVPSGCEAFKQLAKVTT